VIFAVYKGQPSAFAGERIGHGSPEQFFFHAFGHVQAHPVQEWKKLLVRFFDQLGCDTENGFHTPGFNLVLETL
jgi:hypothetical protein